MIRSLRTAASGMEAQQLNIDVIANNLANVNTVGFKKSRAEFQDLFYQEIRSARRSGEGQDQGATNALEEPEEWQAHHGHDDRHIADKDVAKEPEDHHATVGGEGHKDSKACATDDLK